MTIVIGFDTEKGLAPSESRKRRGALAEFMERGCDLFEPRTLIVGFDTEYVNANRVNPDWPESVNIVLSYQFAVFNPANGRYSTSILYTRHVTKTGRWRFNNLLSVALRKALNEGVIDFDAPPARAQRPGTPAGLLHG
jgi:hypothetical protein